jgi:hypothetical protein
LIPGAKISSAIPRLELGERRRVGIVTMSAKKLGLEATLRPVGLPRKPTAKKTENMIAPIPDVLTYCRRPVPRVRGCWVLDS